MFRYTDDPLSDYAAYDAELVRLEKMVPKCCCCGKPIMDDYYYEINDEAYCANCMDKNFKKRVEIE